MYKRQKERRDEIPAELSEITDKSLSKSPSDRHQSALEFGAAIRAFAKPQSAVAQSQQIQAAPISLPPSHLLKYLCAALLPFGLALAGILMFLQGPDGATLRVESDDPNLKITASWAGESTDGRMSFQIEPNKPSELRAGPWIISIDGDQHGRYTLSETELTLIDGQHKRLLVTRTPSGDSVGKGSVAVPPAANAITSTSKANRPTDAELLKRLESIDWKPGEKVNYPVSYTHLTLPTKRIV